MKVVRGFILALFLLNMAQAMAAEPRQQPTPGEQANTVYIFHQPVVMLQAKFGLTTPRERVLRVRNILRSLSEEDLRHPLIATPVMRYHQQGRQISINGKPVMLLTQADLDEGDDLTLDQATGRVMARMEAQRVALRDQYNHRYLLFAALKAVAGALVLLALIFAAWRSWQWVQRYYQQAAAARRGLIPGHWRRLLGNIEARLYGIVMLLCAVLVCYLWLGWVLGLFPWTRVWGESLGEWTMRVVRGISLSVVAALPGLCIVLLIFLITSVIIKLVKVLLNQIESGRMSVPGIHPDTVGATRKLIAVVIWLFALSAAYPFLPGANSLAFKGVSVFFGLMLTLGSAGVMNHAMSGLVLIYSRALRKGDIIRIADNEGQVSEIGMLATKITTRENYVVTVPNAVVVSGKITNLSARQPGGGVNLTVSVTIGYDTPWRQVHAMLELAAHRSAGIAPEPAPLVRQLSLMDWYIAYELQVRLLPGVSLADARNGLYSNIQDVFNEFGVQIMSPNFVMQPEGAIVVKKEHWYAAPATPPERQNASA